MRRTLTIITTNKCNLSCEYCFVKDKKELASIDEVTLKNGIEWFINQSLLSKNKSDSLRFVFFGGEPLIEFSKIIYSVNLAKSICKEANIQCGFQIITNGTLFNKNIERFCIENDIDIQVSIDGANEGHRKPSTEKNKTTKHDHIINNTRNLLETNLNITVNMVYSASKVDDIFSNFSFLINLGIKNIRLRPSIGFDDKWDLKKLKDEMKKVLDVAINNSQLNIHPFKYLLNESRRIEDVLSNDPRYNLDNEVYCEVGKNNLCLNTNGDVYPCHRFVFDNDSNLFLFGNVNSNMFSVDKIRSFLSYRPRRDGGCKNCEYKYLCDNQCLYAFYEKNRNLNDADTCLCTVTKAVLSLMVEEGLIKTKKQFNHTAEGACL
ncbi:MAG: SPASM domain-containing protein [Oligoflexia bacterium]|nr:SPASM domain-containing protein [Oligoflexia bacterium]